jgi:DNA-binding cell septation regulator SpoVG
VQITGVRIRRINGRRVRARVSITINDSFIIGDLKVIRLRKGYFVEFSRKRQPDGRYAEIAATLNAEARKMIEEKVLSEYEKVSGERMTKDVESKNND